MIRTNRVKARWKRNSYPISKTPTDTEFSQTINQKSEKQATLNNSQISNSRFTWNGYNKSQKNEKLFLIKMIDELSDLVIEPVHTRGRNPVPLRDIIYSIVLRAYLNTSTRRLESDLKMAKENGHIRECIPFTTLLDYLESKEITNILKELIEISALPLRLVETKFALDSTGFSTVNHIRYFDYRYRKDKRCRTWRKCHAICGVTTNIITSVEITPGNMHDITQFEKLVVNTSRNFKIGDVCADKGYLSKAAFKLVADLGGQAFIPFKKNSNPRSHYKGTSLIWKTMMALFINNRDEYMKRYHLRSNIETCFSMIKRKFGNSVKCRKEISQDNEILAKILCHNICVLIQEMFLNNIDVDFNLCAQIYVARK